jgi:hypothetical protein
VKTENTLWKIKDSETIQSILSTLEVELKNIGLTKGKLSLVISEKEPEKSIRSKSILSYETGPVFMYNISF